MKRIVIGLIVGVFVVGTAAISFAADKKQTAKKSAPVQLTQAQMDSVVAGGGGASGSATHTNTSSGKTNYVGDNTGSNYKRSDGSGSVNNTIS